MNTAKTSIIYLETKGNQILLSADLGVEFLFFLKVIPTIKTRPGHLGQEAMAYPGRVDCLQTPLPALHDPSIQTNRTIKSIQETGYCLVTCRLREENNARVRQQVAINETLKFTKKNDENSEE